MALNKNHEFEELNGVKCGIVEKNCSEQRTAFLKKLLEQNGYEVIIVPSAPAKVAAAATNDGAVSEEGKAPETITIGVTDYTFNPTNAIFGRLLKTAEGTVVTQAYWQQQSEATDDIPYFSNKETWR